MASDSPTQCLLSYTHMHTRTHTHTLSLTHWAQWEVSAKRAAIVHMRALVFSQEIYSSLKQPAPFPLNHNTMDMLIWSSTWDKSSKTGFLLNILIWLWTVLHTEVMTTQSARVVPCVQLYRAEHSASNQWSQLKPSESKVLYLFQKWTSV